MKLASLILTPVLFVCAGPAAEPDFSGTRKLNPERSHLGALPLAPATVMMIVHSGGKLRCFEAPIDWSAALDGKSARSESDGVVTNVALKWEGAALLINALVSGGRGDYTQMDRWRLSRDGSTLTILRQIVRRTGESESTLVYERPVGAAPALVVTTVKARRYTVPEGTRIPLVLINSVSTKQSFEGDRVYLSTAFPIMSEGRVVIPPGSYVAGTLTHVKRPGRVKGRGELFLRFDSLTLPNGVTRDFRSRVGAIDGDTAGEFDRTEGKISSEGNKSGDAQTVGEATATGASIGTIAGSAAGRYGMGAGVGAAAGAAAGLMGVLLTRGPEVMLVKGNTLEMVLDRSLSFDQNELGAPASR
jgi:type IV secretion system protein VirB10